MATSRCEADGGRVRVTPEADDAEAAAIAAVIQRYLADVAAAEGDDETGDDDRWARAARLEAVAGHRPRDGRDRAGDPWVVAGRLRRR